MGNSGSVHNVASGLNEIDRQNNQYQHQNSQQYQQAHSNINWEYSYGRDSGPQSQPHIKVLPELSKAARLRTTTNGAILQSGGTISGRREPSGTTQPLERSQPAISYDPMRQSGTRSRNNVLPNLKVQLVPEHYKRNESVPYKCFGSEPELRGSGDDDFNSTSNIRQSKCKGSRSNNSSSIVTVTPAPPLEHQNPFQGPPKAEPQRKLRLFKTKAESRKSLSSLQTGKLAAEASDLHFRQLKSPERSSARYYPQSSKEATPAPDGNNWKESTVQVIPMPVFRREKSFDITLLRNRQREADEPCKIAPDRQRFIDIDNNRSSTIRKPVARENSGDADRSHRKSVLETKLRSRKYSQPAAIAPRFKFRDELEVATKQRSMANLENLQIPADDTTEVLELRTPDRPAVKGRMSKVASQIRKRDDLKKEPEQLSPRLKVRSDSKVPLLTKTFYFGMENVPKPIASVNSSRVDSFGKIQMEVIDQFAKSILSKQRHQRAGSESTESLSSEEAVNVAGAIGLYDETNDGRIQVHVRPSLPRRQLEIPRFSPAAAWRMLNEDQLGMNFPGSIEPTAITEPSRQPLEDRIERIYREPVPAYPDNKSGDSGISGDAGLPERPESPRPNFDTKVGPFLTPWTPQQDLDEEDTSSDGEVPKSKGGTTADITKYPSRGHVFSLSLPRESHMTVYDEKDKPGFSSLQKLKRTVSGVFTGQLNEANVNYRSDNWLLSRSEPNSIDNSQISLTPNLANCQENPITNQPSSFSYLRGGKHVMYLPNQPINEAEDLKNFSPSIEPNHGDGKGLTNGKSLIRENSLGSKEQESLQDITGSVENILIEKAAIKSSGKNRGHRFTFQSTVRQIERRRIADKLSKEAEQKEAQRLSELEAMRRVEEEFQRKRAREKASIRHQLRLFSMEENQCISLPIDWQRNRDSRSFPHSNQRAEPDGAASSPTPSPTLPSFSKSKIEEYLDIKMPSIEHKTERKSIRKQGAVPAQTEILSEFRTSRREYFDYRSVNERKLNQQTEHPEIVCKIPLRLNQSGYLYDDEVNRNMNNGSSSHDYRRDLEHRSRSICSTDSDLSTQSVGQKAYLSRSVSPSV